MTGCLQLHLYRLSDVSRAAGDNSRTIAICIRSIQLRPRLHTLTHLHLHISLPYESAKMTTPIPSPPGLPLLGNIFDVDPQNQAASLNRLADIYGSSQSLLTPSWWGA